MKFWLIVKQSFRSFYSKIGLYLTFTIFLILSLSMIAGLFGFSSSFDQSIKDSTGVYQLNQNYNFTRSYVPTWIVETEGEEAIAEIDTDYKFIEREVANQITKFIINEYPEDFPGGEANYPAAKLANPEDENQLRLAIITLGLGYASGSMNQSINQDEVYNNQLVYKFFSTLHVKDQNPPQDNLENNIGIYNKFLSERRGSFIKKYFTNNWRTALFLEIFHQDPDHYWIASTRQSSQFFSVEGFAKPELKYQRLNRQSNLVKFKPDLLETTPWFLFDNKASPFNVVQELSEGQLMEQKALIDQYQYTYATPRFLKNSGLKLGDILQIRYVNDTHATPFVIIGTAAEEYLFNSNSDPDFTLPYQWALNHDDPSNKEVFPTSIIENFVPVSLSIRLYNPGFKKNLAQAQQVAAQLFLTYFAALRSEDKDWFYDQITSIDWSLNSVQSSYEGTIALFYTLATVLSVLIILLLFIVFYFITREIINLDRNSLFYLKAMGVYNSGLSLLTTFGMLLPLLLGIIGGLFGALGIQQMLLNIALSKTVLFANYFSFNSPFIVVLILSVIVIWVGFYAINFRFLRSPALLQANAKKPGFLMRGLIKVKEKADTHLSREIRLTLAFSFKNIYKNIVTFCILSITFGLILYIVQFQSSLSEIAHSYERWNSPYKSVLYQPKLAPIIAESEEYWQSYQVINETAKDELISIKNQNQLEKIIDQYLESINKPEATFNWSNYYFDKTFTKQILEAIGPNPSNSEIESWIKNIYPEADWKVINLISTLVQEIAQQNNNLKDQFGYDDGYNVFFGKVLTPESEIPRNVLAVQTSYLANKVSRNLKTVLFENNPDGRNHFGFNQELKSDDYIQPGTYAVTKGNKERVLVKNPLRVNISSYLKTNYDLRLGDVVPLRLSGFKTDPTFDGYQNNKSALVYAYISHIVRDDIIEYNFYTSQSGVVNYLAQGNHELSNENSDERFIADQKQFYTNLLGSLETNQTTLSNTVFTADMEVPFGIRNITLPFFTKTDSQKPLGSRAEDFYSSNNMIRSYLESFSNNISVFRLITATLESRTEQFISILVRFVIILTVFALIVSLILVTLILLENRRIISVLKALGYRRTEITKYLISGYSFSTLFAVIAAIGISFLAFYLTRKPISQYLGMSVYYLFSWQFFVLAIFLGVIFVSLMAISIAIFTRYQNPKNAFISA